jgi:hypothetical protein
MPKAYAVVTYRSISDERLALCTHTRARARAREIIEEFRAATITQSFLAGLEIANRRITSLPQNDLDSLQHQIMNLRALIKGNFAQRFVDRCWKV